MRPSHSLCQPSLSRTNVSIAILRAIPFCPAHVRLSHPSRPTTAWVVYDAAADRYTCPAGAHLTKGVGRSGNRGDIDHYRNLTACLSCKLRPRCTPEKIKRFKRWKHEAVLDAMQSRLDRLPDAMALRRQTVEHFFETLKAWGGSTPLLTRTFKKVRTEVSLAVLAYNMKRAIKLLGVQPLLETIRA